jgi:hypothetical protein
MSGWQTHHECAGTMARVLLWAFPLETVRLPPAVVEACSSNVLGGEKVLPLLRSFRTRRIGLDVSVGVQRDERAGRCLKQRARGVYGACKTDARTQ